MEELGELGLEVGWVLGDGLRIVSRHFCAVDLLAVLDDERFSWQEECDIVPGSLKTASAVHEPQLSTPTNGKVLPSRILSDSAVPLAMAFDLEAAGFEVASAPS